LENLSLSYRGWMDDDDDIDDNKDDDNEDFRD
jgi:hypothetical protein